MSARITGAFRVEEVAGKSRSGRQCVRLLEALEYRVGSEHSSELVVVPAGFETDFASIPWGLRNLFPPLGLWARPAIVHDFLYATRGTGRWRESGPFGPPSARRWITRAAPYTRAEADRIFLEAMEVVGVPAWRRTVMFRAVRFGGARGWGA